ncbi:MAG: hypothetical protein AAF525_13700, partial [Pseudomonadota bacterium]
TCDLDDLDNHVSLKGAICNIQGRMVTSFRVIRLGEEGLLLRMHRDLLQATVDFLSKYIVFSKATLQIESEYHCVATWLEEEQPMDTVAHNQDGYLISCGDGRFERWTETTVPSEPTLNEDWENADINAGLAWVAPATSEAFLPQMFNYHNVSAISFSKGCYLGQEIVARAQYKGQLKRRLFRGMQIEAAPLSTGDTLDSVDGRIAGTVVATSKRQLLAVLAAQEPTTVKIGDQQITVDPVVG